MKGIPEIPQNFWALPPNCGPRNSSRRSLPPMLSASPSHDNDVIISASRSYRLSPGRGSARKVDPTAAAAVLSNYSVGVKLTLVGSPAFAKMATP